MNRFRRALPVVGALVAIGGMTTLVSYSVQLYRLFCSATGALGTTQRVAADTARTAARTVTVMFDTNVAPGLPWRFRPLQTQVTVHLGAQTPVFFTATNLSDKPLVGHATFNVTPGRVGIYFKKIQCFCFTEERLAPHQTVQMPVLFFVDPKMATDPDTKDVTAITLSYTFFHSVKPKGATNLARFQDGPADPKLGEALFASACAGCHALDTAKVGPPLRHVFGRLAGSVPGYPYSKALAGSGITWNRSTLEKWLAGPRVFVPGALMPMAVSSPVARRDIVAYLRSLAHSSSAASAQGAARPPG